MRIIFLQSLCNFSCWKNWNLLYTKMKKVYFQTIQDLKQTVTYSSNISKEKSSRIYYLCFGAIKWLQELPLFNATRCPHWKQLHLFLYCVCWQTWLATLLLSGFSFTSFYTHDCLHNIVPVPSMYHSLFSQMLQLFSYCVLHPCILLITQTIYST